MTFKHPQGLLGTKILQFLRERNPPILPSYAYPQCNSKMQDKKIIGHQAISGNKGSLLCPNWILCLTRKVISHYNQQRLIKNRKSVKKIYKWLGVTVQIHFIANRGLLDFKMLRFKCKQAKNHSINLNTISLSYKTTGTTITLLWN